MAKDDRAMEDGFDCHFFRRLWNILKIIFPKCFSIPTSLFFFLFLVSILEQYVGYKVGLISSKYYKVLGDKDFQGFLYATLYSAILVLGMALVLTTKNYVSNVLYVSWRQILCQTTHVLYFSGINYYSLNVLKKDLDNPDQRMTQDIERLCKSLSIITITIIISPLKIAYYTYKTWIGMGLIGPIGVFVFFILGTMLNKLVMSPMVKYFMEQEKQEGNFRFKHMHIRMNSESVAFHVSGHVELGKTNESLTKLIKAQQRVINRKFWLDMVENCYDYLSSIVSFCVIAIPVFNGAYENIDGSDLSSLISKNSFLCMTLMYSFSQLVDLTSSVVALSGVTHRVAQLLEKLRDLQVDWDLQALQVSSSFSNLTQNRDSSRISEEDRRTLLDEVYPSEPSVLKRDENSIEIAFILKNVTVAIPDTRKILIKDLSLKISKGRHLLIMGPSSSGKSSLLRIMRGLWPTKEGIVAHSLPPDPKIVIFLPQKPLLTNGSLYEQVIYPLRMDKNIPPSEEVLNEISEMVEKLLLEGLANRCSGLLVDPQWNWDDVLSPGEMQRVCFLRIFYHKPQYVFLDESTSALSLEVEDFLYRSCLELGITMVSVGHRRTLIPFHSSLLHIIGDGTWRLEAIDDRPSAPPMEIEEEVLCEKTSLS